MRACSLEKDSSFMYLLQKIGVMYYRESLYSNAIYFTNQSIALAEKCISNNSCSPLALADNYYNLIYYYNTTAEIKMKYEAIDSCIKYTLKANKGFDKKIAFWLWDKTGYLFNKGEYSSCSRDAKLGEEIIQKYYHEKDSIEYIVSFVIKQAEFLYYSKRFSEAGKILQLKISQFQHTGNGNQLYAFYNLLGLINKDENNYKKSLSCFRKAYYLASSLKYRDAIAQNLVFIGVLYAKNFNRGNTGLRYCEKALTYADATDSLLILRQTGNIYVLKKMYDKAQYFFQQAFNTVKPGMNESTMLETTFQFPGFNQLQDLSDLITDKGDAYVQQYVYTKNDRFLAKIKQEQQLQFASNLVWRTTARNLYEHAIEACYANNNVADAFYFFEKSRAILLNDQINEQRWAADKDIAKQADLKKNIIDLERRLATLTPSSDEYLTIQKKLYASYPLLDASINIIKNKNPSFYQNYLDTLFITLPQLRKTILNKSKTLVEIFSGDSAVYVLTVAVKSQSLVKIDKQLYDSLTRSFNSAISNPDLLNRNFAAFVNTAHRLYGLLFQQKPQADGSMIISPDGVSYPFEALVMQGNDRHPDYFLNHYATSYTYSAKYLTNQFASNTSTSNNVLGMAPVQYKNYQNLASLSGSDISLKNINNYFSNATNYILEKATKNNFLQNFPGYNIIQLYTHASDSSINNDPVIYFSDSALYLSDLIPYRKPVTQLVVLSACETANGKLYEGEGIFSFNRGFAALGIPAAVSNLWSVDNESTYRVTELFYKYLSQGLPTDIALQKAKLEFINASPSKAKQLPYFWAASILTGKVSIIKGSAGFPWNEFIGAALLLLLIAVFTRSFFTGKDNKPD